MKKSAYRLCFCEFVVERDCFLGRQDVRGDLTFLQKIQRLARHVKAFGHSARKHDYSGAMIQQFLHITDLNSRIVTGPSLAPVPFARTAWEKLCVLVRLAFSLDFKSAPGNVFDPR